MELEAGRGEMLEEMRRQLDKASDEAQALRGKLADRTSEQRSSPESLRAQHEAPRAQLARRDAALAEKSEEVVSLRSRAEQLEARLAAASRQEESLRHRLAEEAGRVQALAATGETVEQQQRTLASLRSRAEELEARLAVASREQEASKQRLVEQADLQERLDKALAGLRESSRQLEEARLAREALQREVAQQAAALEDAAELRRRLGASQAVAEELQRRWGCAAGERQLLERRVAQHSEVLAERDSLEQRLRQAHAVTHEKESLERQVEGLRGQAEKLSASQREKGELEQQLELARISLARMGDLQKQLGNADLEKRNLQAKLDRLAADLSEKEQLRAALERAGTELREKQKRLDRSDGEKLILQRQLDEAATELVDLGRMQERLQEVQLEREMLVSRVADLTKRGDLRRELDQALSAAQKHERHAHNLDGQLENKHVSLAVALAENEDMKLQLDALSKQLEHTQRQLKDCMRRACMGNLEREAAREEMEGHMARAAADKKAVLEKLGVPHGGLAGVATLEPTILGDSSALAKLRGKYRTNLQELKVVRKQLDGATPETFSKDKRKALEREFEQKSSLQKQLDAEMVSVGRKVADGLAQQLGDLQAQIEATLAERDGKVRDLQKEMKDCSMSPNPAPEAKRQLQLAHADKDALGRQLDIKQATLEAEVDMQHDLHRQGGELRSQLVRALGEGEALLKQLGGDAVALADIAEWREKVKVSHEGLEAKEDKLSSVRRDVINAEKDLEAAFARGVPKDDLKRLQRALVAKLSEQKHAECDVIAWADRMNDELNKGMQDLQKHLEAAAKSRGVSLEECSKQLERTSAERDELKQELAKSSADRSMQGDAQKALKKQVQDLQRHLGDALADSEAAQLELHAQLERSGEEKRSLLRELGVEADVIPGIVVQQHRVDDDAAALAAKKAARDEARQRLQKLRGDLDRAISDKWAPERRRQLESDTAQAQARAKDLEEEAAVVAGRMQGNHRQLLQDLQTQLQGSLADSNASQRSLASKAADLERQLQDLQRQLERALAERDAQQRRARDLQAQLDAASASAAASKKDMQGELEDLQRRLDAAHAERRAAEGDLQSAVDDLRKQLKAAHAEKASLQDEARSLKREKEAALNDSDNLREARRQLELASARGDALSKQARESQQELQKFLERSAAEKRALLEQLGVDPASAEDLIRQATRDAAALASAQDRQKAAQMELGDLQADLRDAKASGDHGAESRLGDKIAEKMASLAKLEAETASLADATRSAWKRILKDLQGQLESAIRGQAEELERLRKEVAALQGKGGDMSKELSDAKAKLRENEAKRRKLEDELASMDEGRKQLEDDLADEEERRRNMEEELQRRVKELGNEIARTNTAALTTDRIKELEAEVAKRDRWLVRATYSVVMGAPFARPTSPEMASAIRLKDKTADVAFGFKDGQRIVMVQPKPAEAGGGFRVDVFAAPWEAPCVTMDASEGSAIIPEEERLSFALYGTTIARLGVKSTSMTAEPESLDLRVECRGSDVQWRKLAAAFRVGGLYQQTGQASTVYGRIPKSGPAPKPKAKQRA